MKMIKSAEAAAWRRRLLSSISQPRKPREAESIS
jgi:hypothetical protein